MESEDLCYTPAAALAQMIHARVLSSVEVVEAVLRRIEMVNPSVNAYVYVDHERALAQARSAEQAVMTGSPLGPLHGVPVSVKDNIWCRGDPSTSGSRLLAGFAAPEDTPVVKRLRSAGAIIVGRTNMPEFAWCGTTDSPLYGPSRNPWNLALTPGGSSGGAGAALAAGLAPLAVGTDGAGSIRLPASFCGVVGFKPTFGRIGHYPPARGNELVSHIGPMARTVADCTLMFQTCQGYDPMDPWSAPYISSARPESRRDWSSMRAAWAPTLGHIPVEPEVQDIAARAAGHIASLGVSVEQDAPPLHDLGDVLDTLYGAAQAAAHGLRPPGEKQLMDQHLVRYAEAHSNISAVDYLSAVFTRQDNIQQLTRFFDSYDLLITPTVSLPPFPLGTVGPDQVAGRSVRHLDWTLCYPFNYSGQPAISIPAGWTADGRPVGVQIVGRKYEDDLVLSAAAAVEEVAPWAHRRPEEEGL